MPAMRPHWIGLVLVIWTSALFAGETSPEILRAPGLVTPDGTSLADAWKSWEPAWEPARLAPRPSADGVLFGSESRPFGVGGLTQDVGGIRAGRAYAIEARCELSGVSRPWRSTLVRLWWLRDGRPLHPAGMLARGPRVEDGAGAFRDVLIAPEECDGARVSLEVKWPGGGTVTWTRASLRETEPPPPRKVKVGTVYLRPRNSTPAGNLELWCEQVDAAGKAGLDVVCLSEAILTVGTSSSAGDVAETIPGPSTRRLGEAARRNGLWVVAGLNERDGDRLYNTAVLIDREGKLAGTYRKVHLPREEWRKGVTPGDEYPVFETDFGTVAIQICYDWFFPEATEMFALRGAEIVFAPTWGTTFEDKEGKAEGRTVFRVRARDSGVYLVPSVYDGDSLIIDPLGRVLASSDGRTGVFSAEIDLSSREPLWWVGHWRSIGPRHRMPETYREPEPAR